MGLDIFFYQVNKKQLNSFDELKSIVAKHGKNKKDLKKLLGKMESIICDDEILYFRNEWDLLEAFDLQNCEKKRISKEELEKVIENYPSNCEDSLKALNNNFDFDSNYLDIYAWY